MIDQRGIRFALPALILLFIISAYPVQPAQACYGPHITAEIDRTEFFLDESLTIIGQISPPEFNKTVRITFTRPDLSWIDVYTQTCENGIFVVTQQLDMVGYWNIFPIKGHICDHLFIQVINPEDPLDPGPTPRPLLPYKPNYSLITVATLALGISSAGLVLARKDKTKKISSFRLLIQIIFIFLIFSGMFFDHYGVPKPARALKPHDMLIVDNFFGIPMPEGLPIPFLACNYPCGRTVTCALWQIQMYIYPFFEAGRGWGVDYEVSGLVRLSVVFGIIIIAAVVLGRFFCGWICPFGLYVDLLARLRKALKIKRRKLSDKFKGKFHQLGYVILALIIIISIIFGSQAITGIQLLEGTEKGGFVYRYFSAPFCQVCPMKPLCMSSQASIGILEWDWVTEDTTGTFLHLGFYLTSLNLAVLAIVTIAAFFFSRSWCRICPLGALIALFNRFPPFKWISGIRLEKVQEKCTKCGICKRVCPTEVKEVYEVKSGDVMSSQCIACLRCVEMCPYEDCLKFKFAGKTVFKSRNWLE